MLYQNMDGNPQAKLRLSVLATAIASVTSINAFAASEPQTTTMETVVVTASVIGNSAIEDVKEYPGARTVLTSEQIEKTYRSFNRFSAAKCTWY